MHDLIRRYAQDLAAADPVGASPEFAKSCWQPPLTRASPGGADSRSCDAAWSWWSAHYLRVASNAREAQVLDLGQPGRRMAAVDLGVARHRDDRACGCLRDEQDSRRRRSCRRHEAHDLLRTSVLRDFLMTSAVNLYGAIRLRVPTYSHRAER